MKNLVQEPSQDRYAFAAPYAVSAGGGALIGTNIFGVAVTDLGSGVVGEFQLSGIVDLTTLGTDTPSVGTIAYWDNGNKRVTTTSTSNTKIGVFVEAKGSGPTVGRVRLNGMFG